MQRQLPDGWRICRWWGVGRRRAASNSAFQNEPQQSGFTVHDAKPMHACSACVAVLSIGSRCNDSYLTGGGFAGGGESGGGELQATLLFRTSPSNLASLCMMLRPCMPALHVWSPEPWQQMQRQLPDGRRICRWWGVGQRRAASNPAFRTSPSNLASVCMTLRPCMPALHVWVSEPWQQMQRQLPDGRRICRWWGVGRRRAASNLAFRTSPSNLASLCMTLRPCMPALHVWFPEPWQQMQRQLPDGWRICRWWGVKRRRAASNSAFQNEPQQSGFTVHDPETMHACSACVVS